MTLEIIPADIEGRCDDGSASCVIPPATVAPAASSTREDPSWN